MGIDIINAEYGQQVGLQGPDHDTPEGMLFVPLASADVRHLTSLSLLTEGTRIWITPDEPDLDLLVFDGVERTGLRPRAGGPVRWVEGPIDEELVHREWGRYLSVREGWRRTFADACADPGHTLIRDLAPGTQALVRCMTEEDVARIEAHGRYDDAVGVFARLADALQCPPLAERAEDQWMVAGLNTSAGDVGFATWAGPYVSQIRTGTLFAAALIARPVVADQLAALAGEAGQIAGDDLHVTVDGVPLVVTPGDAADTAAEIGVSVAEAAAACLHHQSARAELVARLVRRIAAQMPEDIHIDVQGLHVVRLMRGDQLVVQMDADSILRKALDDPEGPVATQAIARLGQAAAGGGEHAMLDRERAWLSLHLRPVREAEGLFLATVIQDATGADFLMIGMEEDETMIRPIMQEDVDDLGGAARIMDRIREERPRMEIPADVYEITGALGDVIGMAIAGPNIATVLINRGLGASLHAQVAPRLGGGNSLLAYAAGTELLVVAPMTRIYRAIEQLPSIIQREDLDVGHRLGFRGGIDAGEPVGRVRLPAPPS